MADITLLDNEEVTLRDAFNRACRDGSTVRVAVAFAKGSGLTAAPELIQLAQRGGRVELLAGIDFQLTDLSALEQFRTPSEARVYAHPDAGERRVFHPKLYVIDGSKTSTAIVGSSNLTAGGFAGNVEANVLIKGAPDDPIIQSARNYHARLWRSGFALRVTDRFRTQYELLQKRRYSVELALREEADFTRAQRTLKLAVAEAFVAARPTDERKCWLLITSPENYITNINGKIWGDESQKRIARVQPGDFIYFYIKGLMRLGGMGIVTKGLYEDHSKHWPDDRIYPYRFGFSLLVHPPSPLPFPPLVPSLDLFGRTASAKWGQALQASMRELTQHDCAVLQHALVEAEGRSSVA